MSLRYGKTGFKIGTSVGIIIMLLGIAILFGIYQMSLISDGIVQISEEYSSLNDMLTDVKQNQLLQDMNFERIVSSNKVSNQDIIEKAKSSFWFNGGIIDSQLTKSKKIINVGIETSVIDSLRLQLLHNRFSSIEILHNEYEGLARKVFASIDKNTFSDEGYELSQITQIQDKIRNELELASLDISSYTEIAIRNIEDNETRTLYGQVVITIAVGAIASLLGFFIHQINRDLQKEVDHKTEELQKANDKLKDLDRMKNEFIGIASHELKSPIQPIIGFAELAKSGDIDQNEAWDGVTQLAKKLQDLASDVLDVSKIENNQLKLQKEVVKINDLILESLSPIKVNLKNVKIQENFDENIEVEVDKVRFDQVLRNLVSNAIKFTPQGIIKISTYVNKEENQIRFIISDNGRGIPQEILPRIFEKFVTKGYENQLGTGLGLFLCKGIIESHGGKISARNNNWVGASLEFSLPIISLEKSHVEQQKF